MTSFRRYRDGRVRGELEPFAAGLLVDLSRQLVELVRDGEPAPIESDDPFAQLADLGSPRESPDDPALQRLLPDASDDDTEVSAEFRRFTERALRESKVADAMVVIEALGEDPADLPDDLEVELSGDDLRAWMRHLTALRLTLAERLELGDADVEVLAEALPDSDPRRQGLEIYDWLAYVVETLVRASTR